MEKCGVVPNIADTVPAQILQITYDSGVKVEVGNELTPTQVKDIPSVTWEADPGSLYTLCMIDPDVPGGKEVNHWLVVNIPGNNIKLGDTIAEFVGSGPRKGTGLHRYVFLVYKQRGKLTCDEPRASNRSVEGRLEFSVKGFASKYKLGDPIAGNFYQAQYDDYVPILHKQVGR